MLVSQIQEVDESATSSRNSIDNLRRSSPDLAGAKGTPMTQKRATTTVAIQQINEHSDSEEEFDDKAHEADHEDEPEEEEVEQGDGHVELQHAHHDEIEFTTSSESSGSSKHSMKIKISDSLNNNEPVTKARITRTWRKREKEIPRGSLQSSY